MESTTQFIFQIVILIFSVVIHEVSHGYAALVLGDHTAEYEGRLTLNPFKHLDLFGSLILPTILYLSGGFIFGWARPVPYNPRNLRNQKWGPAIVGAAGPAVNISLALFFGLIVRFASAGPLGSQNGFAANFVGIAAAISFLNLELALFNLVPVPPLDGSKVLFAMLPERWRAFQYMLERYGLAILLFFVFFFSQWLAPVVLFLFRAITGAVF